MLLILGIHKSTLVQHSLFSLTPGPFLYFSCILLLTFHEGNVKYLCHGLVFIPVGFLETEIKPGGSDSSSLKSIHNAGLSCHIDLQLGKLPRTHVKGFF